MVRWSFDDNVTLGSDNEKQVTKGDKITRRAQ